MSNKLTNRFYIVIASIACLIIGVFFGLMMGQSGVKYDHESSGLECEKGSKAYGFQQEDASLVTVYKYSPLEKTAGLHGQANEILKNVALHLTEEGSDISDESVKNFINTLPETIKIRENYDIYIMKNINDVFGDSYSNMGVGHLLIVEQNGVGEGVVAHGAYFSQLYYNYLSTTRAFNKDLLSKWYLPVF